MSYEEAGVFSWTQVSLTLSNKRTEIHIGLIRERMRWRFEARKGVIFQKILMYKRQ